MKHVAHPVAFPGRLACSLVMLLFPVLVQAHSGTGGQGWLHGLTHPLSGLDHVLAMAAMGLWAAQCGGRFMVAAPLAMAGALFAGGVLGAAGVGLSFVEAGILASVLVAGLLTAVAVRLPLVVGSGLLGVFALFHGYVHAIELPTGQSALGYVGGLVLASATMLAVAAGCALGARALARPLAVRWAGGAIAGCGLYLCVA